MFLYVKLLATTTRALKKYKTKKQTVDYKSVDQQTRRFHEAKKKKIINLSTGVQHGPGKLTVA